VAAIAWACAALPVLAGAVREPRALRFTEITGSCGVDFQMTSGKDPSRDILEVNGGGVAVFDFDKDGDLDLFLANGATVDHPAGGPGSRLYANNGDGTFQDVSEKVGVRVRRWAMGVAVGDYDGDGYDDLYITCYGPNILLRNDVAGTGRFVDVTRSAGVGDPRWGTSAAFGDVDGDGDADLYVANYLEFDAKNPPDRGGRMFLGVPVMAGPTGLVPQSDVLYENLGHGKFRDATRASGCVPARPGYGLGVAIFDADGDTRLDIYVGNDSTGNFLFRNVGQGKFKEVGTVSGIASNYDGGNQATMGIVVGDVDGNGFPDVFTTNFSSDTNTLHLNLAGDWFDDRTSQYGLAMISRPFLGWGAGLYDFDSDGDEDLFVANGHVYPEATAQKMDSDYEQPPLLFERRGKRFHRDTQAGSMFGTRYSARATAFGDLDGDGDVDVVMTTLNGKVRVFRNDAPRQDVLVVELLNKRGSHEPAALVQLIRGDTVQRRWLHGGSFQSADAAAAYFGVGQAKDGDPWKLRVTWPSGKSVEHSGAGLNRKITVTEGAAAFETTPLRR
jgi:hypothetical protein